MSKDDIQEAARAQLVEGIVKNIAGVSTLTADLQDLCQYIYESLLKLPADRLDSTTLRYWVVRIVLNQYRSVHSFYHNKIRAFKDVANSDYLKLAAGVFPDAEDEYSTREEKEHREDVLFEAVNALSSMDRAIIHCLIGKMSIKALATQYGVNYRWLLRRVKKVKEITKKEYGERLHEFNFNSTGGGIYR